MPKATSSGQIALSLLSAAHHQNQLLTSTESNRLALFLDFPQLIPPHIYSLSLIEAAVSIQDARLTHDENPRNSHSPDHRPGKKKEKEIER